MLTLFYLLILSYIGTWKTKNMLLCWVQCPLNLSGSSKSFRSMFTQDQPIRIVWQQINNSTLNIHEKPKHTELDGHFVCDDVQKTNWSSPNTSTPKKKTTLSNKVTVFSTLPSRIIIFSSISVVNKHSVNE